jgi:hypothetical protein
VRRRNLVDAGSVLADGIVFKRPDYFTHGKAEAALSVAFGWLGLF